MRIRDLLTTLLVAGTAMPAGAWTLPKAGLGAPFPSAQITQEPQKPGACGQRYKFTAAAPLDRVALFYIDQGKKSGLASISNTGTNLPGYRMISFDEKGPGRVLFVTLTASGSSVLGSAYYVSSRSPGCK